MSLNGRKIKGVLLDITGVLVESSTDGPKAIPGSVEAVEALKRANIPARFVTNETQRSRQNLVDMLHGNGYCMPIENVFPPALAMASIIKSHDLKPLYLVHPNCMPDLTGGMTTLRDDYNCVVIGDAVDDFSYKNVNKAFQTIMKTGCPFYALGKGKYYREDGDLTLDVGPYAALLEFATDKPAIVVGKPSREFFESALNDIGIKAEEALMVGDDIVSDVGGAQACGMQGVLVRTGKYTPSNETHPKVKPDKIVDNLLEIVNMVIHE